MRAEVAALTMSTHDRWRGCLYGVAYGDAWGWPVEFAAYAAIVSRHGHRGPNFPEPAVITDDTQMTLALADALLAAGTADKAELQQAVIDSYLRWRVDLDNDRAPGGTCMTALTTLVRTEVGSSESEWVGASVLDSKGCGAIMRVAPAAFLPPDKIAPVAAWQAALTHGHPTAVVTAVVTAQLIHAAAHDKAHPGELLEAALDLAHQLAAAPNPEWATWLSDLPHRAGYTDHGDYLAAGAWECIVALRRALASRPTIRRNPWGIDPAELSGQGWIADEALATALLCADAFGHDPIATLRRAATTGGDSDSIASIAGAAIGAAHGTSAWPIEWQQLLEPRYRHWLGEAAEYNLAVEAVDAAND